MVNCPLVVTVFAVLNTFPPCPQYESPNRVAIDDQFPTYNSSCKLTCDIPNGTSVGAVDLYQIISHNVTQKITTKKYDNVITADITEITGNNEVLSFCCCTEGNCENYRENLGSTMAFVGKEPPINISFNCLILGEDTLHCTWESSDPCIQWEVTYMSRSLQGNCTMSSPACDNFCPSSKCFVKKEISSATFCPECGLKLNEYTTKHEEIKFTFYGHNLWGESTFHRHIFIQERIVQMVSVSNVTVVKSTLRSLLIRFEVPLLPLPFHDTANITCVADSDLDTPYQHSQVFLTATERIASILVGDLLPQTQYDIDIKCKLIESELWSNSSSVIASTESARPLSGPIIQPNSYTLTKSRLFVYFKEMDKWLSRGTIIGYKVVSSDNATCDACNLSSICLSIPIKHNQTKLKLDIYSVNNQGVSVNYTHIDITRHEFPAIEVIVEKDPGRSMIWLSTYGKNGVVDGKVIKVYSCRGTWKFGAVACESDFHMQLVNGSTSMYIANTTDVNRFFGVTLEHSDGIVWEKRGCSFNCRFCFPTKPSAPNIGKERLSSNILSLHLKDGFCAQNQWVPFRYHVTFYPVDGTIPARNKTVLATPFLQNISLEHVSINKMYEISLRIESKSSEMSNATVIRFLTRTETLTTSNETLSFVAVCSCIAVISFVIILLLFRPVCTKYCNYQPRIDLPQVEKGSSKECYSILNQTQR